MQPSGNLNSTPMVPPGQDPGGVIGGIGGGIKSYMCSYKREIYAASALAALSTSGGALVPAGLTAVTVWYVCGDDPPPNDTPGIPGTGAQCNTVYWVTFKCQIQRYTDGQPDISGLFTSRQKIQGPMAKGIILERQNIQNPVPDAFGYIAPVQASGAGCNTYEVHNSANIDLTWKRWDFVGEPTFTAVRVDGQPDNCGNTTIVYPPLPPSPPIFAPVTIFIPITNDFGMTFYMPVTIGPITIPVKIGPFALNIGINGLSIPIDINGNFYLSGSSVTNTTTDQDEKTDEEPNPQGDGGGSKETTIQLTSYKCDGDVLLETTRTGILPGLLAPVIQDLNDHSNARFDQQCDDAPGDYNVVAIAQINSTLTDQFTDTGSLDPRIVAVMVSIFSFGDNVTAYRYNEDGQIQGKFGIFSWGYFSNGRWYQDEGKMQWYQDGFYLKPTLNFDDIRVRYSAPIGVSGIIYGLIKTD